jgi:hypothetical protein
VECHTPPEGIGIAVVAAIIKSVRMALGSIFGDEMRSEREYVNFERIIKCLQQMRI